MKIFLRGLSVILAASALQSCFLDTRDDVKEEEEKKQLQSSVGRLQKSTADINAKFQEEDDAIGKVSSRVDTLESKASRNDERAEKSQAAKDAKIKDLTDKIALHQEALNKMQAQMESMQTEITMLETAQKKMEDRLSSSAAPKTKSEKSSLASADDLYSKKEWQDAALGYSAYLQAYPSGRHLAEANYKLGVCFQEMGQKKEARTFFESVVRDYPKSDEAKKAKAHLKNIK